MKPRLKIIKDDDRYVWCGLFRDGYSSIETVGHRPLTEILRFYFRVLRCDDLAITPKGFTQ